LSWGGSLYVVAITVAAAAFVPLSWLLFPIRWHMLPLLLFVGVFTQVAALMPIRWSRGILTVDTLPLSAAGLLFPGAGVALIAWLGTYDGRRPGPQLPLWRLVSARARSTLEHGLASVAVAAIPIEGDAALPIRTLCYAAIFVAVNYPLVALMFAFLERHPFQHVLATGLRQTSIHSVFLLVIGGGILSILLKSGAGYLMSIGVLGFLFAIRANIADAQRQREAKLQTLKLAAQALDARDRYTEHHSQRVSELSVRIGQVMGLSARELERLSVGGTLHDIGKIGIPDAILNKRGPLSPVEWAIMRRHSDLGADMILGHSALADVAPMVRHHHERWDGSGYPAGLVAEEIPLGGRILATADSYDTITRMRIYRRSLMTPEQAVEDIGALSGLWYDAAVVNALRSLHGMEPLDSPVAAPIKRPAVTRGFALLAARPRFGRLAMATGISSLGDPLTTVASLVSVYMASRSPLLVAATYMTKAVATLLLGGLLAGLSDRIERRRVIFLPELIRAASLAVTPFLLSRSLAFIFPILFVLAAAEAVVSPAREAALPELVRPNELRTANAILGAVNTSGQVIGLPLAALIIALSTFSTAVLFWVDAFTFLAAGLLSLGLGAVGGAVAGRRLTGGIREAWSVLPARPFILIAGVGAFFVAMTLPSLIALAYELSKQGTQAFVALELAVSLGIVIGNMVLWRLGAISSARLMVLGLGVMALLSPVIAASGWIVLTGFVILLASIGNAWYVVASRTALQERGRSDNLGSLMATRFTVGNLMVIAGSALGGWLAGAIGPRYVYGLVGVGLGALALVIGVLFARNEPQARPGPSFSYPMAPMTPRPWPSGPATRPPVTGRPVASAAGGAVPGAAGRYMH
jgi:MFS family permease